MTDRAQVIRQLANDIAPELERLIDAWLGGRMLADSQDRRSLEQYLWDNKVGFLRVLNQARRIDGERLRRALD